MPSEESSAPDPRASVLDSIRARTGRSPRVHLHEEGSGANRGPVIDPTSDERTALPRGRASYQILGEIARGGMGVVLRGQDTDLGRDVALKVLSKELAEDEGALQRFIEEAQIGGQLQHPGIVPVYELGLMGDRRPYFTMKLVKGKTLAGLLSARSTPEEDRARLLDVFESVCQTIAYAHSRGVIHRDLKPSNVMVGAFGEVQVVDWGLAKVLPRGGTADEERAQRDRSNLTVLDTVRSGSGSSHSVAGSVMGTPAYMPPEQATGNVEKLDERSDVFALGAILCEILTGLPPYAGEFAQALQDAAGAHLDEAHRRLDASGAAPALVALAKQCMTPAQGVRPADAGRVARGIREYAESREHRAREAEVRAAVERRSKRVWTALAAGVLLLGVGGTSYKARLDGERLEERLRVQGEVTEARLEATSLRQAALRSGADEDWERAESAARRALAVASANDAAARDELSGFVEEVVAEREVLRLERERTRARAEALDLLQQALDTNLGFGGRLERLDLEQSFAHAFAILGVDPLGTTPSEAAERLRAAGIEPGSEAGLLVGGVLDDWGVHQVREERWSRLLKLAQHVDPDPFRDRLRNVLLANDREELFALARSPEARQASPTTTMLLATAAGLNDAPELLDDIIEPARENHPGDFRMNGILGLFQVYRGAPLEEALPYVVAAESLRPGSPVPRLWRGGLLAALGRWDEARPLFELARATASTGQLQEALKPLGESLVLSSRREPFDQLEGFVRSLEPDPELELALGSLLMVKGAFEEASELLGPGLEYLRASDALSLRVVMDYAYALTSSDRHAEALAVLREGLRDLGEVPELMHRFVRLACDVPDASERRPEEALPIALRLNELAPGIETYLEALAASYYRSGRYEEALGVHYSILDLPREKLRAPAACYRAMALARIGERELARDALKVAKSTPMFFGQPSQTSLWQRDVVNLRAEAERVVERE